MTASLTTTSQVKKWTELRQAGDESALNELFQNVGDRLFRLARKMLKSHPRLHRWEQTDDVLQNATFRLCRALRETTIQSPAHFFHLAALQFHRELIDLGRHYFGPHGVAPHHPDSAHGRASAHEPAETAQDPARLTQWTRFHEQIEELPVDQRELFNLFWYHKMPQKEAAEWLGISERTLQRCWLSARMNIHKALEGDLPD